MTLYPTLTRALWLGAAGFATTALLLYVNAAAALVA